MLPPPPYPIKQVFHYKVSKKKIEMSKFRNHQNTLINIDFFTSFPKTLIGKITAIKMSKLIDFSLNVDFSISNTQVQVEPDPFKSIITLEINKHERILILF